MHAPPPAIDGVGASRIQLPSGPWSTIVEALAALFPAVGHDRWLDRIARGRVFAEGVPITGDACHRVGLDVHYYREVAIEAPIAGRETVLFADAHLLVADKPHFLPVTPAGGHVTETLLARLVRRTGNTGLVPLHRIDRDTAGLVLFSTNPASRGRYQALFRERAIDKRYEALAPPLPGLHFPHVHRSRLARGEPFFRMREVEGPGNAETVVDVAARGADAWRYRLQPVTGRKHQLRVHMAALGAAILGDPLYPELCVGDPERPLRLVAKSLAFDDPLDGRPRRFDSGFELEA